jgi:hypothetical protein
MIIQIKTQATTPGVRGIPSRFPFRVCYAVTKGADQETLLKLLRYAVICPVTEPLVEVLKALKFETKQNTRQMPDGQRPEPLTNRESESLIWDSLDQDDWVFVAPIHPTWNPEEGTENAGRQSLTRVFRSEIWAYYQNPDHRLPAMALRLPDRTIPNMCVACLNVIDMQEGSCSPGSPECQRKMHILVKREEEETNGYIYNKTQP